MNRKYECFIAGGGIGGLLSAAVVTKHDKSVFLAERLPFLGGRFTSHKYKGFEIPSGAVHMIPHSRKGPLGQLLLQNLKLPLVINDVEDFTAWYWPNKKPIKHKNFWGIFKAFPKRSQRIFVIKKLILGLRNSEKHTESFHEYLESRTEDPQIFQFFNAVTGFALSLDISQLSTASMFRFLKRLYQRGRPGVPIGGSKAVIFSLAEFSHRNGLGNINKNCELKKLEIDDSKVNLAVCLRLDKNEEFEIKAKNFILNLGHPQINQILKNSGVPFRFPSSPIASGGGFIFRAKASILGSSAVAQFPENEYFKGAVEPSRISPGLAPNGEHLLCTHQIFKSSDVVRDSRRARDEVFSTFPQLKEEDELVIHTFHKDWPVNFASQGNDLANFSTEIKNLFFVGDGFKGNQGWMMTEGVTYGVKQVIDKIISNK
ncbi:MAG: FAD-dependent oxidoreductase [Candidatus Hodarchaeota archaeon]